MDNYLNKKNELTIIKTVNEMSDQSDNTKKYHNHHQKSNNKKQNYINSEMNSNDLNSNSKGDKIKSLKDKIEKQMKDYVEQEEYEEALKLVKKLNLISKEKWHDLENEVEKIDYTDFEYKSSAGFLTDDEIAVLASDIHTPYSSKSVNEIIELSRKNSGIYNSTLNWLC